jgi:hypothetical protein
VVPAQPEEWAGENRSASEQQRATVARLMDALPFGAAHATQTTHGLGGRFQLNEHEYALYRGSSIGTVVNRLKEGMESLERSVPAALAKTARAR